MGGSASARTTTVNRRAQARLAARISDAPAVGDTPPAAEGVGIHRAHRESREQERQSALREGAAAEEEAHREPIVEGVPVLIMGGGNHPVPPTTNVSRSIVLTCKAGFLPAHLNCHAREYAGSLRA